MEEVAPATVNRSLAAVRRAMYLAYDWELIDRVPKFKMLEGERHRKFVLTGALRDEFIGGLPELCKTIARFLVNTGLRSASVVPLRGTAYSWITVTLISTFTVANPGKPSVAFH